MYHITHDYLPPDCNFDTNFCGWYSDPSKDFTWERQSYETTSDYTGPASDHTSGCKIYYNFVEYLIKCIYCD